MLYMSRSWRDVWLSVYGLADEDEVTFTPYRAAVFKYMAGGSQNKLL
jgi:hypothetical protein